MIARMRKFPFVLFACVGLVGIVAGNHNYDGDYDQEYQDIIELSDADSKLRHESLKNIFSNLDDLKSNVPKSELGEDFEQAVNERVEDNNEDILDDLVTNTKHNQQDEENLEKMELRSPYDAIKTKMEQSNKDSFDESLGDVEAGKVVGISYDEENYPEQSDSLAKGQEQMFDLSHSEGENIVEEIHGNSLQEDIKGMFDEDDSDEEYENNHRPLAEESPSISIKSIDATLDENDLEIGNNEKELTKKNNDMIGDDEIDSDVKEEYNNIKNVFNDDINKNDSYEDEDSKAIDDGDIFGDAPESKVIPINDKENVENEIDDEVKEVLNDNEYENNNIGDDEITNDNDEINDVQEVPVNDNLVKGMFDDDIDDDEDVDDNDKVIESNGNDEIKNYDKEVKGVQEVPFNDKPIGMLDDDNVSVEEIYESNQIKPDKEILEDDQKVSEKVAVIDEIVKGIFDDDMDTVEEVDDPDDGSDNIAEEEKLNIIDEIDNILDSFDADEQNDKEMYDYDDDYVQEQNKMLSGEIRKVMEEIEEVEETLKSKFGYEYVDDNEEANTNEDNNSDEDPNENGEVGNVSLFKILEEVSPKNNLGEETDDEPAFNVDSIPDTVETKAELPLIDNVNDALDVPEPTAATKESSPEESVNVVELSPDNRITLTSPAHPEPYPNNITIAWQLTGDSGTGIEINVTMTDLDGDSDDYLLIKPGRLDSNTDSILFTFNIDEDLRYRFHDYNEAYVKFVSTPKPVENQQYRGFSLSAKFIDKIQEATTTTETPIPLPGETHRVFLGGTTPSNFLNISEEFRQILVDMITMYINENGIDAGIVPVNEVLQITYVTSCQINWPNNDNCVAVRYGASFIYNDTQYSSDATRNQEMSETSLSRMWNTYQIQDPFATRLQRLGVWDFIAPDDAAVLTLWLLISGGVVMAMVLITFAIWRWNCFEDYTAMSRYSDTESVISKKSDASLFPTPHQCLPSMLEGPRDSFNIWSDQLPPKYEDARFPEPGRSYDNRSFVRDGEFFDLESDEEIVMSLPDGPGAKYQMQYPPRYNKDAEA